MSNLASLYRSQARFAEAETLYRRALAIHIQKSGTNHPDTAASLNNLAFLYEEQEKYPEAESLYRRALTIFARTLGEDHPNTKVFIANLTFIQNTLQQMGYPQLVSQSQ